MAKKWLTYEKVCQHLLNSIAEDLGLSSVSGKVKMIGDAGTYWEIDAIGYKDDNSSRFVLIEIRRNEKSRQSQEKIAAFAYRIKDLGAEGGIIVSHLGLQSGAKMIAKKEGIVEIKLNKDSTWEEFTIEFLNKLFIGLKFSADSNLSFDVELVRKCAKCDEEFSPENKERYCINCIIK